MWEEDVLKESKQIEKFRPGLGKPFRSSFFHPSEQQVQVLVVILHHPDSTSYIDNREETKVDISGWDIVTHKETQFDTTGSCQRLSAKAAMAGLHS